MNVDDYIEKFPLKIKEYLKDEKHKKVFEKKVFEKKVRFDYEPVKVYRAVHSETEVSEQDFLDNFDDAKIFSPSTRVSDSLGSYAVSVNQSLDALKAIFKIPHKTKQLYGIAVGMMKKELGPAEFDGDRPHHNWFLYDGSVKELIQEFEMLKNE